MVRVVVRGLVKKPDFNNHMGNVKKAALESGDERVAVMIEGIREHETFYKIMEVSVKKTNLAKPFEPRDPDWDYGAGVVESNADDTARLVGGLTREFVAATLLAVSADTFIPEILNLVIGHLTGTKHCPIGNMAPDRRLDTAMI